MSSRGQLSARPVGATSRSDLFTSARATADALGAAAQPISARPASTADVPSSVRDRLQGDYGVPAMEEDPLQLEHMLGYSGNFRRTVLALPHDDNLYVKR